MASTEARFPLDLSRGTLGGPGFDTNVTVLDSSHEERVSRLGAGRHSYNARYALKNIDDCTAIKEFFYGTLGPAVSFRFFDWSDHSTAANHRSAPSATDVIIGTGDGSTTQFQLVKKYTVGALTRTRNIEKPIHGETLDLGIGTLNVLIALDGTPTASGWTVNTTNGIVTFTSAPADGVVITAGFGFDVPCRFGIEIDKQLPIVIEGPNVAEIDDIPIIEVVDELQVDDNYYYGGSIDHGDITSNVAISSLQGRVHSVAPQVSSLKVILPDFTNLPTGGPHFVVINEGTQSIVIEDHNMTTVATVAVNKSATLWLGTNNLGVKVWRPT